MRVGSVLGVFWLPMMAQGFAAVLAICLSLPELERTCDRVVILAQGRLCADGDLKELLAGGEHELVTEARFASPAAVEVTLDAAKAIEGVRRILPRDMDGGVARWRVAFDPTKLSEPELRRSIGALLAKSNAEVRLLEREQASLEKVFLRLMEQGPAMPTDANPSSEDAA